MGIGVVQSALTCALINGEANILNWNFKQFPLLCWGDFQSCVLAEQHSTCI